MTNIARTPLPLVSSGCACCAPAPAADQTPVAAAPTAPSPAGATTAAYQVEGMTCGHCVNSITGELTALDGVTEVHTDLVPGGVSTVTVTTDRPLPLGAVEGAVAAAGYDVATT